MSDSFSVQYASFLIVAKWGLGAFFGPIAAFFVAIVLGAGVDLAILAIDISIDRLKEAMKEEKWKDAAAKAYANASKKVYTEEEKNAIRKEYLDALGDYAGFGDGVPNS